MLSLLLLPEDTVFVICKSVVDSLEVLVKFLILSDLRLSFVHLDFQLVLFVVETFNFTILLFIVDLVSLQILELDAEFIALVQKIGFDLDELVFVGLKFFFSLLRNTV